jgi:hypothetical protein
MDGTSSTIKNPGRYEMKTVVGTCWKWTGVMAPGQDRCYYLFTHAEENAILDQTRYTVEIYLNWKLADTTTFLENNIYWQDLTEVSGKERTEFNLRIMK